MIKSIISRIVDAVRLFSLEPDDVATCPWCERSVFIKHLPVRPAVVHSHPACSGWRTANQGSPR
jgi:hypothetical protein